MIQATYEIEMKGLASLEGIECMRRVLQVYMDDFANCFGLSIGVETKSWESGDAESGPRPLRLDGRGVARNAGQG